MTDKVIYVNELVSILGKHFNGKSLDIHKVEVASINNQLHPEEKTIGIGGVLSIHISYRENEPEQNDKMEGEGVYGR